MDQVMISAHGLRKRYGALEVLQDVDLEVPEGTVLALLGPNGAGKTTTVRILSTLLDPDGGTATVAGHDVVRERRAARSALSLTGQSTAVDDLLTGEENLRLVAQLRRLPRAEARRRTAELLADFDLEDAAGRLARTYSGGMKRRLDIAISLLTRPPVIFLDEPTTGLDPRSRQAMWEVVRRLVADGTTILLTTQYLEEADQLADRITVVDGGRVVREGTAAELKRTVEAERVELTFDEPGAYEGALRVLGGTSGASVDAVGRTITLPSDGSAAGVKQLLDRLDLDGVQADRIALHRPTLDDVFLALTATPPTPGPARQPALTGR